MANDASGLDNGPIEVVNYHAVSMSTESSNAPTPEYSTHRRDRVDGFRPRGMTTDSLESGLFNQFEPGQVDPVIQSIRSPYHPRVLAADVATYVSAQERAANACRGPIGWLRMSIIDCASSGQFSTDRTRRQYQASIWHLEQVSARALDKPDRLAQRSASRPSANGPGT